MAGINPYIQSPNIKTQKKSTYKIRFVPENTIIEITPSEFENAEVGQPGSILDIAIRNNVGIDHSCGGVCACSTCHVVVRQGLESCSQATEDEEDMLDMAPGLHYQSRLACQCIPNGTKDIEVEIPRWNRNLVSEGH